MVNFMLAGFLLGQVHLSGLLWLFAGSGIVSSGSGNGLLSSSWRELQGTWSVWLIRQKWEHALDPHPISIDERSRNAQISHSEPSLSPALSLSHSSSHKMAVKGQKIRKKELVFSDENSGKWALN